MYNKRRNYESQSNFQNKRRAYQSHAQLPDVDALQEKDISILYPVLQNLDRTCFVLLLAFQAIAEYKPCEQFNLKVCESEDSFIFSIHVRDVALSDGFKSKSRGYHNWRQAMLDILQNSSFGQLYLQSGGNLSHNPTDEYAKLRDVVQYASQQTIRIHLYNLVPQQTVIRPSPALMCFNYNKLIADINAVKEVYRRLNLYQAINPFLTKVNTRIIPRRTQSHNPRCHAQLKFDQEQQSLSVSSIKSSAETHISSSEQDEIENLGIKRVQSVLLSQKSKDAEVLRQVDQIMQTIMHPSEQEEACPDPRSVLSEHQSDSSSNSVFNNSIKIENGELLPEEVKPLLIENYYAPQQLSPLRNRSPLKNMSLKKDTFSVSSGYSVISHVSSVKSEFVIIDNPFHNRS